MKRKVKTPFYYDGKLLSESAEIDLPPADEALFEQCLEGGKEAKKPAPKEGKDGD